MSNGRFVILINSYQHKPNLINDTTASISSIDKIDGAEATKQEMPVREILLLQHFQDGFNF